MTELSPEAQLILSRVGASDPASPLSIVCRAFAIETLRAAAASLRLDPSSSSQMGTLSSCQDQLLKWVEELERVSE